jgi:predicted dehydrogenase
MNTRLDRRRFLRISLAGPAGVLVLPSLVPASARGAGGATGPGNRVVMGFIGTGGQGSSLLNRFLNEPDVQVVAVNDVDLNRREAACDTVNRKYQGQGCTPYRDFRELLARSDLDAVCVATPDHWHALVAIAAARAKKDIYCEKPLANSIGESRAVVRAVQANGRVLQTGSHERSGDNARFACELVRNGRIGRLHTVRIHLPCHDGHHQQIRAATALPPPQSVPEGFDYDFWLGHTPRVPYFRERCHFAWRFNLAYGGGEMTDRGAHVIDLAQLGAGTDHTGPVEIEAAGVQNPGGLYNAFWDFRFVNSFANGVKFIGTTDAPRGLRFEGSEGWIFIHVHGAKLEASHPALLAGLDRWKDSGGAQHPVRLGRSPGHLRNFLDCVKSRRQPVAGVEAGHHTAVICHLNNLAMRLRRKLKWDPELERVRGDAEANAQLTPRMRPPWKLG